jgi:sigma-E factor negative regulatory protein RseC
MIEEQAIILSTDKTDVELPFATIEIVRKTACGLCGKTRGCGNAIWGKIFSHQSTSFRAENKIDAKVGQNVIVGIDEKALMKGALLLYLVPLVFMFTGIILLSYLFNSDFADMLGAFIGLLLGFIWVKGHVEGKSHYQKNQPKILRLAVPDSEINIINVN